MDDLRIVTLNLWNDREQPARRLEVVADGLRALEPDLVALQEVRESPHLAQATTLGRMLGMYHAFGVVDANSPGGRIGNAVLSRFAFEATDNLPLPSPPGDPRSALRTRLRTPAGVVQMASCHLSWEPHLALWRERQVLALDEMTAVTDPEVHVVVAGDFNTAPDSKAIRFLTGLESLNERGTFFRDAFARRHPREDGFTFSSKNPCAVRWIEQNRRIDYIFVRGPVTNRGERTIRECRVVLDFAAADGTWPSDHFGVLAVIQLTPAVPDPRHTTP